MTDEKHAPNRAREVGKVRATVLPMDVILKYLPPAFEEGVLKYYENSWRQGMPVSEMVDKAMRHLVQFHWDFEDYDKEALEHGIVKHHLAAVIFCCTTALHTLEHHPEKDDRPHRKLGVKQAQTKEDLYDS